MQCVQNGTLDLVDNIFISMLSFNGTPHEISEMKNRRKSRPEEEN